MQTNRIFSAIALFILAAVPALAQQRVGGPVPVLLDVVGSAPERMAVGSEAQRRRTPAANSLTRLEREAFDLMNDARSSGGLAPLEWDDDIAALARSHARSMAENRFFSHRGLDGRTVDGRANEFGIAWSAIGENIASFSGSKDPCRTAVDNWLKSAGHRQNILGGRWNRTAIGIGVADDGTYYFTQVFMQR